MGQPRGPGIRKSRSPSLVPRREVVLWHASDYRWREVLERADVLSEGAIRDERDGFVYYGTTSILCPFVSRGGAVPDDETDLVARALATDPHVRVRSVRIACREAQLRTGTSLGRIKAELCVRRDPRGLRLDVDVEAPVLAGGRARRAGR